MLGAILGLVVALYFIGAVHENTTTLAKLAALSILLGFAAPKLWVAQERIIVGQAMKRLNQMLDNAAQDPERQAKATGTTLPPDRARE